MLEELKTAQTLDLAKSATMRKHKKSEAEEKASFKKALTMVLNEEGSHSRSEDDVTESKVGTKLTAVMSRKVIILLMTMLIMQPLQDQMTYISEPDSFQQGLKLIYQLGGGSTNVGRLQFDYMIEIQK